MSRLDDEYDPSAHHDLDQVSEEQPDVYGIGGVWTWVCACGADAPNLLKSAWAAYRGHDAHRDQETR